MANLGETPMSGRAQKVRARRMAKSASAVAHYRKPRHRAPSGIETTPGGDRDRSSDVASYDYIPTYKVGGKPKLFFRVMDIIEPDAPMEIWKRRGWPKKDTVYVNGRSDRVGPGGSGRTLRPSVQSSGACIAADAIDRMFDGRHIPSEPPKRDNRGDGHGTPARRR